MYLSNMDGKDPGMFRTLGLGPGISVPLPGRIYPDEIQKEARQRSDRIFDDWKLLRAILDRHEPTIYKRWSKKTRNQRTEVLLAAWPKMAATHRPDFVALGMEDEDQRESGRTKLRDSYMWPYINLEDLTKPKILPLFLQARARNTPDVFAMTDTDAARLGYVTKAITQGFLSFDHTMMFTNRTTPATYGELIPWDENKDALGWLKSGRGVVAGEGLMILEIQEGIYRFLADCCKRIMHDVLAENLTSDRYPIQPPVSLPKDTADGFASLAVMAAEAPYRAPSSMDLQRLKSLIEAKKSAAEDHIWALREDPGYFRDTLLENKEHRQETLKDTKGGDHPVFADGTEEILWRRVLNEVVTGAHVALERWSELLKQVQDLRRLQVKHEKKISLENGLPEEYLNALLKFHYFLDLCTAEPKRQLHLCAMASPPLRYLYARLPPVPRTTTKIDTIQKPNVKLDKTETELVWLLRTLWENRQNLFYCGLTNIMDELERLQQSQLKARAMISPYIAEVISNLAVLSEALRQLNMFQPWARTFPNLLDERKDAIHKHWVEWTGRCDLTQGALAGSNQMKIVQLGTPEGRKFYYPVDKRRTKENVEAMRAAEHNLDKVWMAVDKNLRSRNLNNSALQHLLSQSKILERTPEWMGLNKDAKQSQTTDVEAITKPLSELYFDLELRTERTIDRTSNTKTLTLSKAKTKGVVPPTAVLGAEHVAVDNQPQDDPPIQLEPRALKVFRTLFYTPSLSATPGELAWTDFLHAMVATGFVPEKLYGSVWQFSPTRLDVERSIQFHEPHPSGKLPYKTARRFGRRLNRAYGWEGESFVAKEA
jgi:hypothetical protein